MSKQVGPDFGNALISAGLANVPCSWNDEGVYFNDDVPQQDRDAVQAVYDAYEPPDPLAGMRSAQLAQINAAAQRLIDAYISTYPDFERLTWATQEAEFNAWQAASADHQTVDLVPWCASAATARGVALADFMAKVAAKVVAFKAVSSAVAGKRQAYEDQIAAATTEAQVTAIKWSSE